MLGQQRVGSRRPLVRLPRLLLQAAADGLAIEIQATGDLGDREQLLAGHPVDLPPAVFLDHAFLLEATCLGSHGASFMNNGFLHPEPPRRLGSGGDFSMPTGGELCMPDDTRSAPSTLPWRFGPADLAGAGLRGAGSLPRCAAAHAARGRFSVPWK